VRTARRLSLAGQFLIASFLISVLGAALVGAWVGQQIEAGVVTRAGAIAALYVDSVALSNATRHGRGQDVAARLWSEGGELRLRVADRGPGFDPSASSERAGSGLGLAGMRERAQMLGGTFALDSSPGRGTVVEVSWPLVEARAA
jgi:signal transduction histidine kinase